MEYRFNTPLNGNIAMTYHYHEDAALRRDKSLYKFVWVQSGTLDIEVDHVVMHLEKDEIISLTPLHHVEVKRVEGEYLTFLFNSNFYCIYGCLCIDRKPMSGCGMLKQNRLGNAGLGANAFHAIACIWHRAITDAHSRWANSARLSGLRWLACYQ